MMSKVSISSFLTPVGLPRQPASGVRSGNCKVTSSWHTSSPLGNAPALGSPCKGAGKLQIAQAALENVDSSVKDLQELTKLDYYQYLEDAGEDMVVVDFYTDWCGPCKLMYPKLVEMAEEMQPKGVRFVKFNCNKFNKELGSGLGVRVAPTFFLYKGSVKVAEMTGARVEKLRDLIEANM